jgi:hypothetical protein
MEDKLYDLRYRFYKSEHIKEIISEIDDTSYDDNKPEYANAKAFFEANSSKPDVVEKLEIALSKYGD